MRYAEFRDSIQADLRKSRSGKTWKELQRSLNLPYKRPCPEWVGRLEQEIGLLRDTRRGSALVWRVRLP